MGIIYLNCVFVFKCYDGVFEIEFFIVYLREIYLCWIIFIIFNFLLLDSEYDFGFLYILLIDIEKNGLYNVLYNYFNKFSSIKLLYWFMFF